MEEVAAFPLYWPEGWPRTDRVKRKSGSQFADWTVYTATERLKEALRLMEAKDVIVSTSIPLRRDGYPLSKPPVDGDPGVAVYFKVAKRSQCIAIDTYQLVELNLRAITLTIEAMRAISRHGGAEIIDRAFTGFTALPQNAGPENRPWWEVLEVNETSLEATVRDSYRRLAKIHHPDVKGGSHEKMVKLNAALADWEARR